MGKYNKCESENYKTHCIKKRKKRVQINIGTENTDFIEVYFGSCENEMLPLQGYNRNMIESIVPVIIYMNLEHILTS